MGLDGREEELVVIGPPGIREYLALLRKLKVVYLAYPVEVREFGPDRAAGAVRVYESPRYSVSALPLDHRVFTLGYRIEERARAGRFNLERALEIGIPEGPLFGRLQAGQDVVLSDGRTVRSWDVVGPPRPGKILAYCTDTRPCRAGVELGSAANLLIHEATFATDLASEAGEYGHSTATQAARIAEAAKPARLVITHISARYPDARPLLGEARSIFENVELAEDLMEFEVRD
jgi:ribonuclease Z